MQIMHNLVAVNLTGGFSQATAGPVPSMKAQSALTHPGCVACVLTPSSQQGLDWQNAKNRRGTQFDQIIQQQCHSAR